MFLIDSHQVVAEFNANGNIVRVVEFAFHESHKNRRLAYSRVAYDDHFEKAVIVDFLLVVYGYQLVE